MENLLERIYDASCEYEEVSQLANTSLYMERVYRRVMEDAIEEFLIENKVPWNKRPEVFAVFATAWRFESPEKMYEAVKYVLQ